MSNEEWQTRAGAVLPGAGFGNFDAGLFVARGEGSHVWDENGKRYIDYLIGSGPMILGHSHPEVLEAITSQLAKGTTFFANNSLGVELAEVICDAVPSAEQLRYVSTGGEADMYAIRLARAFTGRDKVIKFEGGYHGMSAEAQMSLAPGEARADFPAPVADSAGIPASVAEQVLVAPFNDLEYVASLLEEYSGQIAGIIAEPLQRLVPPVPGFLRGLRKLCDQHHCLLIFDEIVTGFRFAYGGAQSLYGVSPDICTLGKIIGGGLPLAAITSRADVMAHFDAAAVGKNKSLMQVGTLSGNPLAAVAGLKTLEILRRPGAYERLQHIGETLMSAMQHAMAGTNVPFKIVGHPTLFDVLFTDAEVINYRDTLKNNKVQSEAFNRKMRELGVLKSPGKLYASLAITDSDLEETREAMMQAAQAAAEAS